MALGRTQFDHAGNFAQCIDLKTIANLRNRRSCRNGGRQQRAGHTAVVNNSCLGDVEPRQARNLGLNRLNALRVEPFNARQAIFGPPLLQACKPSGLIGIHGHHHLPTNLMLHPVGTAEIEQLPVALNASARLQRTRFVVEPRVNYPRIAPRLVQRRLGFFFQEQQPGIGVALPKFIRRGRTHDAAAHHCKFIEVRHSAKIAP